MRKVRHIFSLSLALFLSRGETPKKILRKKRAPETIKAIFSLKRH